jgi:hypothetical protein
LSLVSLGLTLPIRIPLLRHCRRAAVALLLISALSACGGDDNPATSAIATTATTATTPTTAAPPTSSPAPVIPPATAAAGKLTITNTTPASYQWDVLVVGKTVHVDASEVLTAVPGKYRGLKFLRTANADRFLSAADAIAFQTDKDVAVLVAYDTKATTRPLWLADWADTADTLTTSAGTYRLLRKPFASGAVTLGGNELGVNSYAVVVDDGSALGNTAPTISGTAASEIGATRAYVFVPSAGDSDGDTLTFSATHLPGWASLNPVTGALTGTPSASHVGAYTGIVITVSDGSTSSSLQPFGIRVNAIDANSPSAPPAADPLPADPVPTNPSPPAGPPPASNSPPRISGTPPSTVRQGQPYAFTPSASDADGDGLAFSIANRPSWATFNNATGRLSGTPSAGAVGTHGGIVIGVSDGQVMRSLPTFAIAVTAIPAVEPSPPPPPPANSPPSISGSPATTIRHDQSFSFTPSAADADGNALTFSISNRPAWASFSTTTGRLSGTPSSSDVGTYSGIVIEVSDGVTSRSLPAFTITVTPATTGSATLSWTPPTQNTDGSPLTNLAGYKVYWGRSPRAYAHSVTLNNPGLATYVIEQLTSGSWYFSTTSINSAGVESGYSNEGSKTIP